MNIYFFSIWARIHVSFIFKEQGASESPFSMSGNNTYKKNEYLLKFVRRFFEKRVKQPSTIAFLSSQQLFCNIYKQCYIFNMAESASEVDAFHRAQLRYVPIVFLEICTYPTFPRTCRVFLDNGFKSFPKLLASVLWRANSNIEVFFVAHFSLYKIVMKHIIVFLPCC